jgi:hypothetical protein
MLNELAWYLAVHPEPRLRNPTEAATLARRLADLVRGEKLGPDETSNYSNTVGVARYRAGDWKGALEAFGRTDRKHWWKPDQVWSRELAGAGGWFFRAMAHWRLGDKDMARKEYAEAVRWLDEYAPEDYELNRIRAEAAALLGIKDPPAAQQKATQAGKKAPPREAPGKD